MDAGTPTPESYNPEVRAECSACQESDLAEELNALSCREGFRIGGPEDANRGIWWCMRLGGHDDRHQACADDPEQFIQLHPALIWKRGAVRAVMHTMDGAQVVVVGVSVRNAGQPAGGGNA